MVWDPRGAPADPGAAAPGAYDPMDADAPTLAGTATPPPQPSPLGRSPAYPLGPMRVGYVPNGADRPVFPGQAAATPPHAEQRAHAGASLAPETGEGWGDTSLGLDAATAAGLSYLGWWLTGLLVYFGERQNRFVRFHAFQSILWTGLLTIVSVLGYVVASLLMDAYLATHSLYLQTLSRGVTLMSFLGVVGLWLVMVIAAFNGHALRIPVIGAYAERYAAPVPAEPRPADGQ